MNCNVCGRTLQEDARFCDFCGNPVPEEPQESTELNKTLLLKWVLISLFVTIGITLILMGFGLPVFIGGLFLPFFFARKKVIK